VRDSEKRLRLDLPRRKLEGFDYTKREASLEIPLAERLAAMR
jgi:hypothetical protein